MKTIVDMTTNGVNEKLIGIRLRAERERLGMTQAGMAVEAGVSRATQVNYESGKRLPDFQYLQSAGRLGVDVPFILTGLPTSVDTIERRALVKTLTAICERLGVDYIGVLERAYEEAEEEAGKPSHYLDRERESLPTEVEEAILDAIGRIELDDNLLAEILEAIDNVIESGESEPIGPQKKAKVAMMLYRAFLPARKVDVKVVCQAVRLAAG